MTERATTLEAVAAHAGVHAATVSRVIGRPELVKPETRERVQVAIDELGYVPNRAARELAGGETGILAILVPDITNPYFSWVVQAAQRRLHDKSKLATVADTGLSEVEELRLIERLAPNVDGFILCSPVSPSRELLAAVGNRSAVVLNRRVRGLPSVLVEQAEIVGAAVDHLRALGHRRIASLRGPSAYWSTRQRSRAEQSIEPPLVALASHAPTFAGGVDAAAAVANSEATAVVAFNDAQALGLMAGLESKHLAVPGDISVVGSDDVPFAAMSSPALTTIAAPLEKLGVTAADVLARSGSESTTTRLGVELIVRESTGMAP